MGVDGVELGAVGSALPQATENTRKARSVPQRPTAPMDSLPANCMADITDVYDDRRSIRRGEFSVKPDNRSQTCD